MKILAFALLLCAATTTSVAQEAIAAYGPEDAQRRLVVRGTTDIAAFGPVIEAFIQTRPGLGIDYEQWGSNALFGLSAVDCATDNIDADLVVSSGVHQMVKLVNDACAQPYKSQLTSALPSALRWRDEIWGITSEPAVIVYNRGLVPPDEVPLSRFDLLDLLRPAQTRYAGRVATYDIEESGLGFLFAFLDAQEATTYGGLLESFGRTRAVVTCCSAEIIDGVANGTYLIAYNVLGSYALARAREDTRIGVIAPNDYTLLLSRAAMIPKGAPHTTEAAAFLDFILSAEGQAVLRNVLLLVSVDEDGEVGVEDSSSTHLMRPIQLSPTLLVALDRQKRQSFIRRWRATFTPRQAERDPESTE